MASVIDSLIVTLGLDAKNFTQGQKETIAALKKTEDQSNKTSKELETHAKKSAQAFSNLKNELLSLAAIYISFGGIKSFIQNTVLQTAALGRMSTNLDMNAKDLAEWQLAAKNAGGTAEGVTSALTEANNALAQRRITGQQSEQLIATQNYAGPSGINIDNIKSGNDLLLKQADIVKNILDRTGDINIARHAAMEMGLPMESFGLFKGGSESLQKKLDAQSDLATQQANLSKESEDLRKEFDNLENQTKALGVSILHDAMPAIKQFSDYLGSPETKENIHSLVEGLGTVAGWVNTLGKTIGWVVARLTGQANDDYKKPEEDPLRGHTRAELEAMRAKRARPATESHSGSITSSPSSLPRNMRNHNPGNIEYGSFAKSMGAIGSDGRFAIFPDDATGSAAMTSLLAGKKSKGLDTIAKLVGGSGSTLGWLGGGSDLKDASGYIADVSKKTGIHPDQTLTNEQLSAVQQAMAEHEGWRGNNSMLASKSNISNLANMPTSYQSSSVNSQTASNSSVDTTIHTININTQATDANGISQNIGQAITRNLNFGTANANQGLT